MCQHPLWGEDSVKLANMAELPSRNSAEEAKQFQKAVVCQGTQRLDNRVVK